MDVNAEPSKTIDGVDPVVAMVPSQNNVSGKKSNCNQENRINHFLGADAKNTAHTIAINRKERGCASGCPGKR